MSRTTADRLPRGQKVTSSSVTQGKGDVEAEISRILRENQNIYQNLSMLESEERVVIRNKSEQIRHLAKNYERLADPELDYFKEPVNHICATICRELDTRKLGASSQLARAVLPEKYKQTEFTPYNFPGGGNGQDQQQEQQPQPQPSQPEQQPQFDYSTMITPEIVQEKSIDLLEDTELRDYTEELIAKERQARELHLELKRRAREGREKCDLKKIPLSPDFEQDHEPHHSAESPDTGPSEAWEACLEFQVTIKKLADKLYRWRPPKQVAKDLKFAFEEEIEFYKPFIDEKYRKSQPGWWVTQLHNIWHGKHAAAIMNSTPIDEKTKRALTREQVGDKYEEDLKRALRFVAAQKVRVKLWWWFHEMNEKGIAKRAKDLNPVLSEKSFT